MCEACGTIRLLRFYTEQEAKLASGELFQCPWCRCHSQRILVAGHLQCENCHQVVESCCEGDSVTRSAESPGVSEIAILPR